MIAQFRGRFGAHGDVHVSRAPGRVNLIGEHTDYNLGFVLPIALDRACYIAAAPSGDGRFRVYSEAEDELAEWPAARVTELRPEHRWTDYVIGVAQELARAGFDIVPLNLYIRSTVPEGSGLSSSAALEVSSALALLDGRALDPLEMARLCQRAETGFVGLPCGIMDQYVSVFGREGAAIRIDCRTLEHEAVALPSGAVFVTVNTMVKHALASSAYRERTVECATAVEMIRRRHPGVESLRDVTPEMFKPLEGDLPPVIARRARHVITEDARVDEFVAAAAANDLAQMGRLFVASHRSLQHDYEVSSEELDFLVDTATVCEHVYGARMTGGGFGGCTVNMVRPEAVGRFTDHIAALYRERFNVTPQIFTGRPSGGAGRVTNLETIPAAV